MLLILLCADDMAVFGKTPDLQGSLDLLKVGTALYSEAPLVRNPFSPKHH